MAGIDNLKSWKPGQSGNPSGKPKGAIHLSTMIQNYLNDDVDPNTVDKKEVGKKRMLALTEAMYLKAQGGDVKAADWVAKYGYGQKYEIDQNVSGSLAVGTPSEELANKFSDFLKHQK